MRRNLRRWHLILLLLPAVMAGACAMDDATRCTAGECGGTAADAGTAPPGTLLDGGLDTGTDPSPESDSPPIWASSGRSEPAGGLAFEAADDADASNPALCYDGLDNDGDDLVDCDDAACSSLGTCRVGSGEFCAPDPIDVLDFTGCDGTLVDGCLSRDVEEFGPVRWIASGGFHGGGDENGDGGFALPGTFDLRTRRVELTVRLGDTVCSGPCIESAGVALTAQQRFTGEVQVRPAVGLVLSGGRNEVSLIVADEVVATWSVAPEGSVQEWSLVVRPTGVVSAMRTGDPTSAVQVIYGPIGDARLVVYGRNDNRPSGMGDGARVERLDVQTARCDMPDAWSTREPVTVLRRSSGTYDMGATRGVTVAMDQTAAGEPHLAFAFEDGEGQIFFGGQSGGPELILAHTEGEPALSGELGSFRETVLDPELHRTRDGALVLFFTAVDAGGKRSIGRAEQRSDSHLFEVVQQVLEPSTDAEAESFEMPTVAYVADGQLAMIVRAELAPQRGGGHAFLAFLSSDEGKTWTRHYASELLAATRRGGTTGTRFDADEIAHPSLLQHGGAYRITYAGRRGTRWSLGLLVSDQLVHWREPLAGRPVLGRGTSGGFDRLGPVEADALVDGETIALYYLGTDGARGDLGRAVRLAPDTGGM